MTPPETPPDILCHSREPLAAGIPSFCWITDPEDRLTFLDPAAAEFLGPSESLLGTPWLDSVHPADRAACQAALDAARQSRQPFEIEHRLRRRDGVYRWVLNRTSAHASPGFIAFCLDLTQLQKIAARLRELSLATEYSPVTVVVTDAAGNIEYVNPKFTSLTGYTLAEVIGKNSRILKSGETSPEAYRGLWAAITSGREWRGEFHNKRKDGTLFWESAVIAPVRDPAGNIAHFVAVKEDITERKRLAAEFAESQRLAQAAARAKAEFLANMSHEIRTPMNGILGMAYLLSDAPAGPERGTYLQVLTESAQSLLDLLSQVLELARVAQDQPGLVAAPFSLAECLAQSTSLFSAAALGKGLRLTTHMAPGVPETLTGDLLRLRQVLANLIGNAIKFSASGSIMIAVQPDPSAASADLASVALQFSVRDHGIGIPPDKLALIFEPFEQADNSPTRKYSGAGLGLTLSRKLVEAMGGRIWAASEPGRGSTFFFTARFPHPLAEPLA